MRLVDSISSDFNWGKVQDREPSNSLSMRGISVNVSLRIVVWEREKESMRRRTTEFCVPSPSCANDISRTCKLMKEPRLLIRPLATTCDGQMKDLCVKGREVGSLSVYAVYMRINRWLDLPDPAKAIGSTKNLVLSWKVIPDFGKQLPSVNHNIPKVETQKNFPKHLGRSSERVKGEKPGFWTGGC